jgi:hypothetical protein
MVRVRSTEDFRTKIEGIGSHGAHIRLYLPFIQVQTALGSSPGKIMPQGKGLRDFFEFLEGGQEL